MCYSFCMYAVCVGPLFYMKHYILHINRHASPEYVLKAECKTLVEFIVVLVIVATTWMQLKCPLTNDWIKMYSIYTVKYYSAVKKKKRMD